MFVESAGASTGGDVEVTVAGIAGAVVGVAAAEALTGDSVGVVTTGEVVGFTGAFAGGVEAGGLVGFGLLKTKTVAGALVGLKGAGVGVSAGAEVGAAFSEGLLGTPSELSSFLCINALFVV